MTAIKKDKEAKLKARFKALKEKHDQESKDQEDTITDNSESLTKGVIPERNFKKNLGCG